MDVQFCPDNLKFDVIETDAPKPTFPEALSPARLVNPATFRDDNRDVPEVTLREEPTPTLPVVVKEEPEITPSIDDPETVNPELNIPMDVCVVEPPIPTFPDVVRVVALIADVFNPPFN